MPLCGIVGLGPEAPQIVLWALPINPTEVNAGVAGVAPGLKKMGGTT
jgi:hypothetical protein